MTKRLLDLLAILLIGDGVLTLIRPRRHCLIWDVGPEPCRALVNTFAEHRAAARVGAVVEAAVGYWLACREEG